MTTSASPFVECEETLAGLAVSDVLPPWSSIRRS